MLEKLKQKAQQAEMFAVESESTKVGFEANHLKSYEVEESRGVALRAMVDGRLGFAAASDLRDQDKLVANVLESAQYGDAVPLSFPAAQPGAAVDIYDERLASLPSSKLVEMGREVIDIILAVEPEAQVKVQLERQTLQTRLDNSAGASVTERKSPFSLMIELERVRGDDVLVLWEYTSTAAWDDSYLVLAKRLAEKLRLAQRSAKLESGRMPVLFSPSGTVVFGLPLSLGLNGKNVYRGISPMAGKLGEHLFDDKLTLLDDPTLPGRPGSAAYDDEGVTRRKLALIEKGRLNSFIYDLKTAAQAGAVSTGHGERSLFSLPSPGFTNMVLENGDKPLAEIISGIESGLLVEDPLGLGQSNAISGVFSNSWSLAYKIEHGEIVGRVKDITTAGNIYQDLRNIAAISRESEWVYGGMSLPYILLPELNVITKA